MFFQFSGVVFSTVWFGEAPGDVVDAVVEEGGFDLEFAIVFNEASFRDGVFNDVDFFVVDGAVAEAVEVLFAARWVVAVDLVLDVVEVEAHEHGAKPEAVIAVEVADEDAGDAWGRNISEDELPLGPFARIKEEPLLVPANEVGAVVALASRLLARRAEYG